MKTIIAIDPGRSGGIAVSAFGAKTCHAMPETEGELLDLLRSLKSGADIESVPGSPAETICVLEEVSRFAGKAQPGSAMFRFGDPRQRAGPLWTPRCHLPQIHKLTRRQKQVHVERGRVAQTNG